LRRLVVLSHHAFNLLDSIVPVVSASLDAQGNAFVFPSARVDVH